jgi:hypothetical protein
MEIPRSTDAPLNKLAAGGGRRCIIEAFRAPENIKAVILGQWVSYWVRPGQPAGTSPV